MVPMIEQSDLRDFHLDPVWSNQSEADRAIAFDHMIYIVRCYAKHGWTPVLVTDLREEWLFRVEGYFSGLCYAIITLFTCDRAIAERIQSRSSGFMNIDAAIAWNRACQTRQMLQCGKARGQFWSECSNRRPGRASSCRCQAPESFLNQNTPGSTVRAS